MRFFAVLRKSRRDASPWPISARLESSALALRSQSSELLWVDVTLFLLLVSHRTSSNGDFFYFNFMKDLPPTNSSRQPFSQRYAAQLPVNQDTHSGLWLPRALWSDHFACGHQLGQYRFCHRLGFYVIMGKSIDMQNLMPNLTCGLFAIACTTKAGNTFPVSLMRR